MGPTRWPSGWPPCSGPSRWSPRRPTRPARTGLDELVGAARRRGRRRLGRGRHRAARRRPAAVHNPLGCPLPPLPPAGGRAPAHASSITDRLADAGAAPARSPGWCRRRWSSASAARRGVPAEEVAAALRRLGASRPRPAGRAGLRERRPQGRRARHPGRRSRRPRCAPTRPRRWPRSTVPNPTEVVRAEVGTPERRRGRRAAPAAGSAAGPRRAGRREDQGRRRDRRRGPGPARAAGWPSSGSARAPPTCGCRAPTRSCAGRRWWSGSTSTSTRSRTCCGPAPRCGQRAGRRGAARRRRGRAGRAGARGRADRLRGRRGLRDGQPRAAAGRRRHRGGRGARGDRRAGRRGAARARRWATTTC